MPFPKDMKSTTNIGQSSKAWVDDIINAFSGGMAGLMAAGNLLEIGTLHYMRESDSNLLSTACLPDSNLLLFTMKISN